MIVTNDHLSHVLRAREEALDEESREDDLDEQTEPYHMTGADAEAFSDFLTLCETWGSVRERSRTPKERRIRLGSRRKGTAHTVTDGFLREHLLMRCHLFLARARAGTLTPNTITALWGNTVADCDPDSPWCAALVVAAILACPEARKRALRTRASRAALVAFLGHLGCDNGANLTDLPGDLVVDRSVLPRFDGILDPSRCAC